MNAEPPVTAERSALMRRIKGKDSKPELAVPQNGGMRWATDIACTLAISRGIPISSSRLVARSSWCTGALAPTSGMQQDDDAKHAVGVLEGEV